MHAQAVAYDERDVFTFFSIRSGGLSCSNFNLANEKD
jgi:hypothetical protein